MTKGQLAVLLFATSWISLIAVVGLLMVVDEANGHAPAAAAAIALIATFPLAVAGAFWRWLRGHRSRINPYVLLLVAPWVTSLAIGFVVAAVTTSRSTPRAAGSISLTSSLQADVAAFIDSVENAPRWVSLDGPGADSASVRLTGPIRLRRGQSENFLGAVRTFTRLDGSLQNFSGHALFLGGFRARFLDRSGRVVYEWACPRADPVAWATTCSVSNRNLRPDFAADFSLEASGVPQLARRDTVSLEVLVSISR